MGDSPQNNDRSLEIMLVKIILVKVVPQRKGLAFYQQGRNDKMNNRCQKKRKGNKRNNNCFVQRNNRRAKGTTIVVQRNNRRAKGTTIVPFKGTTGAQKEQQLFIQRNNSKGTTIVPFKGVQKEQQLFHSKEQQARKRNNNCSIQRNNRHAKGTTIVLNHLNL
jgi:hypothetical protein